MMNLPMGLSAEDVIGLLALEPHPEGGFFRETFRDLSVEANGRASSTAIYYLLREDEISHWHRVDSAEVWHWYAGGTIRLKICADEAGSQPTEHDLGCILAQGERPQVIVPPNAWQMAECAGAWTLVGCTVAPGFEFSTFELAAEGWFPGKNGGT